MNYYLNGIVMAYEYHHFRVMCSKHLWHIGRIESDIWIARCSFYQGQSVGIFFLPKAMDNVDFDEVLDIWVEGTHEKVDIMEVVEFPAFGYQGVSEDVF